ncbi:MULTISPECIES: methyltransferase domain-containing protein [unclassified Bradyrhizobium]|uniref:class I SAM-dependent methyltransferase n=1 Tax=unclassified Bradyrhizobium TaxID=2631580 RepID=UPI001CD78064|nr:MULTISPECIES: methyltransferase domain-containing protein [unclassified Bradyrhizobium]MCA1394040.1 methyltransferase domain-containing protein [Bradyrhizobium sp. IC3123]MCA1501358.1 methyltransferase domain-containing protein [Bradyrhizobium sp. NBAIM14]
MAKEFAYGDAAAVGYDRAFAHVSRHFLPFLLSAARVASGMKVLDIATGTGLAAAESLLVVGPTGHVVAADVSEAMVGQARQRLSAAANITFAVEDGQSLSFADSSFDALICSLGLMFFPHPSRGLSEFLRVLRPGGRAAVSVATVPERTYNGSVNTAIAKHSPAIREATARMFSLGDPARLRQLFEKAGFQNIELTRQAHRFSMPSFDAYFGPYERGDGPTGQAYLTLPQSVRDIVREETQRSLGDRGGPVEIEVQYQFASGQRR